ncbi:MAG: GNAT family N-acetyltransferase [Pseudomonadota bacterium]
MSAVHLREGFDPAQREAVAALYHAAFSQKLRAALGAPDDAIEFLTAIIDPNFAIVAEVDGAPVGVAGYKTADGAFTGGKGAGKILVQHYGTFGALWRGALLSLLEREAVPGILLMDGLAVLPDMRGRGVGTLLLAAIDAKAKSLTCDAVRLDVVDINPRARALYEREGFVATERTGLGVFAWAFGFREVTTMMRPVTTQGWPSPTIDG